MNQAIGTEGKLVTDERQLFAALREKFHGKQPLWILVHSLDRLFAMAIGVQRFFERLLDEFPACRIVATDDQPFRFEWTPRDSAHWRLIHFWHDTYRPYLTERKARFGSALMSASLKSVRHTGHLIDSLCQVYEALNYNARAILLLLLREFLAAKSAKSGGIRFEHFYRLCREEFLTSSEATLRQHLTEVRDHSVVRIRSGRDGAETIFLMVDLDTVRKFVELKRSDSEAE